MDPLAVNPVSPATLSALSALRPPLPLAAPVAQDPGTAALATQLSTQDLAQTLFQQALQKAVLFPLAEPAGANLAQDAAASLLAALTAPQATAAPTTTPTATSNATAAGAALTPQTQDAVTTAAATTPALTAELPAVQDSSSLEFALQTALRFGAGVVAQAAPPFQPADLAAGLIRDPAAVQRLGNLQPHAGGPGPEAFAHPQAAPPLAVQRVLRTYELAPTVTEPSQLDLMA